VPHLSPYCLLFFSSASPLPSSHSSNCLSPAKVTTSNISGRMGVHDIGGTDISYNFMARQYKRPTRQSYRNSHRHVGDPLDKYDGLVRTRLPCDLTLFYSADSDFVGVCVNTRLGLYWWQQRYRRRHRHRCCRCVYARP
jgi:hypothetical protein